MTYSYPTNIPRVRIGAFGNAPTLGRTTDIFIALLPLGVRAKPAAQLLTIGAGGGDGTTITVTQTIAANIQAGQYLRFTHPTTAEDHVVRVATTVSSGSDITIAKAVAGTGIPDGAESAFPGALWDRTGADVDRSYNRSTFNTFNTGGDEDGVVTGASRTITLPGIYHRNNEGYLTALFAAENGREVWVTRIVGKQITEGPCVVTAAPSASPVDGPVGADLTLAFQGKPFETFNVDADPS